VVEQQELDKIGAWEMLDMIVATEVGDKIVA
ncbi:hypothetical protein Tco_1141120, partial [Tanacetum coccineum]